MEPSPHKPSKTRLLWLAVAFCVLAAGAGAYYWWYDGVEVKYDRITNAKRV